jgi:hypothetical protein
MLWGARLDVQWLDHSHGVRPIVSSFGYPIVVLQRVFPE